MALARAIASWTKVCDVVLLAPTNPPSRWLGSGCRWSRQRFRAIAELVTSRARTVADGPVKALDQEFLAGVALAYLNRFDTTEAKFGAMLWQRARKAALALPEEKRPDEEQLREWIADLLARYRSVGLVNDARYADNVARSLRQRGLSSQSIVARLRAKGVGDECARQAVGSADAASGDGDSDLAAALRFVRRKRFGAFRKGTGDPKTVSRELSALARAGFSFDTARRALNASAEDTSFDPSWD